MSLKQQSKLRQKIYQIMQKRPLVLRESMGYYNGIQNDLLTIYAVEKAKILGIQVASH